MKLTAKLLFTLAVGTSLAGCGAQATGDQGTSSTGNKIVVPLVAPLSGSASDYGDSAQGGAEYALQLKKDAFKKLGFDVELLPQDDQADPKQGIVIAEGLISNPDVLAVLGHLPTGSSLAASGKYEEAGLAMVSPTSTGAKLTEEGKKVVHRVCARDDQQGVQAALFAKNQLHVKKVVILHDKQAYGQAIANQVKEQLEKDGVQVLSYEGITPGEKDYSAVLNQVIQYQPDLIYFGGYYAEAGILVKQAREKGFSGAFMGGDGIESADFVKIAGDASTGTYFTSTNDDVTKTEEGKKWVADFEKATGKKLGIFTSYGYDTMNVILQGLEKAITANGGKKPTREQVLDAIHHTTDFQGQFVKVSFDEKGDNKFAQIYAYKYDQGQKVFVGAAK